MSVRGQLGWLGLVVLALGPGCDAVVGADCAPWSDPCGSMCCSSGMVCNADLVCVPDPSTRPDAGLLPPWPFDAGFPADATVTRPDTGFDGGAVDADAGEVPDSGDDGGVVDPPDSGDDGGVVVLPDSGVDGGVIDPPDSGDDGGVVDPPDSGDDGGVVDPPDSGVDGGVVVLPDSGVDGGVVVLPDSGVDGGVIDPPDSGDDGGVVDPPDSGDDGGVADPDAGDPDSGTTACPLGTQLCGTTCVDTATDDQNCGGCGVTCASTEVCSAGACTPTCQPPRTQCPTTCANLAADPNNCGFCGNVCGTGICYQSACVAPSAGHVVLVGHSLQMLHPAVLVLASNAIFLPVQDPVAIGRFQARSSQGVINGLDTVLNNGAATMGRTYTSATFTAQEVTQRLAEVDVFVIVAQDLATDVEIQGWAADWSLALSTFVRRGGTVVVFDSGGTHSGTWQILQAAGLFFGTGRTSLVTGTTLDVAALADAVARGAPLSYPAPHSTSTFTSTAAEVVVETQGLPHLPVVFHRVIRP